MRSERPWTAGVSLDDFQLRIPGGGTATVYEGVDMHTKPSPTRVALKVLHLDPLSGETQMPKVAVHREIEYSGRLHHPNICRLLNAFVDDERSVVVMVVRACPPAAESWALSLLSGNVPLGNKRTPSCCNPFPPRERRPVVFRLFITWGWMRMQFELVDGLDLLDVINASDHGHLDEPYARLVFSQLVAGVSYIHQNELVGDAVQVPWTATGSWERLLWVSP